MRRERGHGHWRRTDAPQRARWESSRCKNAKTGALLWQFETGETGVAGANGAVGGPIAVYETNGAQHIAFVMNHHVWAFRTRRDDPERTAPPALPVVDTGTAGSRM